jgi:hypothetical protein
VATDSNQKFESVADFTNWVAGTTGQITVTDDTDGTITLSIPNPLVIPGKVTAGSFASPTDVTATREHGFELHYSGNNYNVTGIRSRASLVTTDTSAQATGGLLQAANNDGINAGVLNGCTIEAIGKSDSTSATITTMRGALVGCEWGAKDTVTTLHGLHVRIHSMNATGEGSFGTACAITIENEAVGGNGQSIDAGIQFVGTNLSGGNKAFDYGINFGNGVEYDSADMNLSAGEIHRAGVRFLKEDNTNFNIFFGSEAFNNDDGQDNVGLGYQTGYNNDTTGSALFGDSNIYIGYQAGYGATTSTNNTGYDNVAIGKWALYKNTSGYRNFAFGPTTGFNITQGHSNVMIGYAAAFNITTGINNFALGRNSLFYNQTGSNNICIGTQAGLGVSNNSFNRSVFIGHQAGFSNTTGSDGVYLGYKAGYNQTTLSNRLIIDNQDRSSAANEITNCLMYGVFDATPANQSLRINGEILGSDGAKIGDGGSTNYTEIEADGTVEFHGAATVWNDANLGVAQLALPVAGQPDEDEFVDEGGSDTGISTWAFAVGEKVSGSIEIPHDYKEGSDITFHVHWQGIAAPTGTDNVKWQCTYTVAQAGTTLNAATTTVVETAFDTQYEFMISSCTAITGTNFNMGDQFLFTLERVVAAGDAYAGDALVATVGLHYECDTVGSRQILTK